MPGDRSNLAWQAASALAKAAGLRGAAVRIEIRKRIPVAAGLAGGSADAAATLVACNELWQTGLSQRELAELAAGLGSDVPFALVGGTAVGRGRGEHLTPALAAGQLSLGAGVRPRRACRPRRSTPPATGCGPRARPPASGPSPASPSSATR